MSDQKKTDGGPAFPVEGMWSADGKFLRGIQTGSTPLTGWHEGMTLRDYFAAKAMPLFLKAELDHEAWAKDDDTWVDLCAQLAYDTADAMLKAREQ